MHHSSQTELEQVSISSLESQLTDQFLATIDTLTELTKRYPQSPRSKKMRLFHIVATNLEQTMLWYVHTLETDDD